MVATLKRYLSEPKYRITLDDLVSKEVENVTASTVGVAFDVRSQDTSGPAVLARLKSYEAASATLMQMAFVAGQWSEGIQLTPWINALAKLAMRHQQGGGQVMWLDLQRYPATLLLYCFGLGAIASERWIALNALFNANVSREHRADQRAMEVRSMTKHAAARIDAR